MATTNIHSISTTVVRALSYISNYSKTANGRLIQTYACSLDPDEAEQDFLNTRNIKNARGKTLAQHMIVSFKPNEITPEKALEFGNELCDRFLKDQYQYMLAVHNDRNHIHCHIVFNNTNMENGKSFKYLEDRGKKKDWLTLRKISDELCKEYGLSVVQDPEKNKGKSHYEWDMNRQGLSWKTQLKYTIDECVMESENFDDFLGKLSEKNIEAIYNPEHKIDLKFKMEGQEKWSRARTLGWYYETPQIKRRIEQYQLLKTGRAALHRTKIIDTSAKRFEQAKGLERWANIQNMKEASRVINILTNLGINSTDELENKSLQNFGQRVSLAQTLNDTQHKIDELSECIKQVRIIKKYQPIRSEYKAQTTERKKEKYAEKYAPELKKYESANAYLKTMFPDKQVPSEKTLTEQRNKLIEKRNGLNIEYKTLLKKLKDLDYARQTVEDYLKNERSERKRDKGNLE